MAEALKDRFGLEVIEAVAGMISRHHREFDHHGFVAHASDGFVKLELMDRGRKIAESLRVFLPADYPEAVTIVERALRAEANEPLPGGVGTGGGSAGDRSDVAERDAMYSFRYLSQSVSQGDQEFAES